MSRRSYSTDDVNRSLATLAKSGGNVTQAAKELDVSPTTLRKWRDLNQSEYEVLESEAILTMRDARVEIIRKQAENLVAAAHKIGELIKNEHNLDRVSNAMKAINGQLALLTGTTGKEVEAKEFISVFRE